MVAPAAGGGLHVSLIGRAPFVESSRIDETFGAMVASRNERILDRFSEIGETASTAPIPRHSAHSNVASPHELRTAILEDLTRELHTITAASESRVRSYYPAYSPNSIRARAAALEHLSASATGPFTHHSPHPRGVEDPATRAALAEAVADHGRRSSPGPSPRDAIHPTSDHNGVASPLSKPHSPSPHNFGSAAPLPQMLQYEHNEALMRQVSPAGASQIVGAASGSPPNAIVAGEVLELPLDDITQSLAFSESTPRSELMAMVVALRTENGRLQDALVTQRHELALQREAEMTALRDLHEMEINEKNAELSLLRDEVRRHEATIASLFELTNTVREENAALAAEARDVRARATQREADLLNLVDRLEAQLELASGDCAAASARADEALRLSEATVAEVQEDCRAMVAARDEAIQRAEQMIAERSARFEQQLAEIEAQRRDERALVTDVIDEAVACVQSALLSAASRSSIVK